ncbi:MAG: NAD-dependent epimerase/dehydratase family protein [Rhodocyclales bacterium GT-UBC]|nr:MAG: NAD-dependent epimerase/dehydratase family protein [Rhodocyclales bacterium GT-UBC]
MILVSGASGFIGKHLMASLLADSTPCRALLRTPRKMAWGGSSAIADLSDRAALIAATEGVETVIHCAGYAHAFSVGSEEEIKKNWAINFEGTRNLIEAAGYSGVKRFVFLSSVKAMADSVEECVDESQEGVPSTVYGESKRAAENVVLATGQRFNMHVVNLRLAMVYGRHGRGNLERMAALVGRGVFPPLPETGNRRSLVHVRDVVDVVRHVSQDPRANGRTYIVASPHAPSGRELFDAIRAALGLPKSNIHIPEAMLKLLARLGDGIQLCARRRVPFNSDVLSKLLDSACYSPEAIWRDLGWRAAVPLSEGLREMLGNEKDF